MKHTDEEPWTIDGQIHYTILFKNKNSAWVWQEQGKIKYYLTLEEAKERIKETFNNGYDIHVVEEATVFEWKKTPVFVKKNIKPVIESNTTFDIEVFNRCIKEWSVRRYGFEKLSDAMAYVESRHFKDDYDDQFRIVQRDVTVKTSIV